MSLQEFEHQLVSRVLDILWKQWTALGVAGSGESAVEGVIIDPEALLIATLTFGRRDARLFDEVLDWLTANGDLINVSRLLTLVREYGFARASRPLAAVSKWVGTRGKMRQRWASGWRNLALQEDDREETFFQDEWGISLPAPRHPDPVFLEYRYRRERISPRKLARPFPGSGAAPLILQLRALFGVNSRCELCCLLATRSSLSGSEAAFLAGYTPRAVQDALSDMSRTDHVVSRHLANEVRYSLAPGAFRDMFSTVNGQSLRFPPFAAILSTLDALAAITQRCVRQGIRPDVARALIRKELDPAAHILARTGLPVAFSASLGASPERFFELLSSDSEGLVSG